MYMYHWIFVLDSPFVRNWKLNAVREPTHEHTASTSNCATAAPTCHTYGCYFFFLVPPRISVMWMYIWNSPVVNCRHMAYTGGNSAMSWRVGTTSEWDIKRDSQRERVSDRVYVCCFIVHGRHELCARCTCVFIAHLLTWTFRFCWQRRWANCLPDPDLSFSQFHWTRQKSSKNRIKPLVRLQTQRSNIRMPVYFTWPCTRR